MLSLPRDDTGVDDTGLLDQGRLDPRDLDPTAGGTVHWAPLRHRGHRQRLAMIAAWLDETDARALVVDVSVEVTILGRLLGTPVVAGVMPGERPDRAHDLGHAMPSALVAPWPDWVPVSPHLRPHATRLHRVGGISRFEGRARTAAVHDRPRLLVLGGAGGSAVPAGYWGAVSDRLPEIEVTVLGGTEGVWVDDPWPWLCAADLVITHAGQNAIADVAAAGVPAVVVPEPRPFDEQRTTANVLRSAELAAVLDELPAPDAWPGLLTSLRRSPEGDPARARESWARWQVDGAAARAAGVVDAVVDGVAG